MFWTTARTGLGHAWASTSPAQRSLFTTAASGMRKGAPLGQTPRPRLPRIALLAPPLAGMALAHHYFSTSSILLAESSSASSSLFRGADPSAMRRPTTQVLFLSVQGEHRKEWRDWIGFFRLAGYNCIDLNVAKAAGHEETVQALNEELDSQIRLMSLQRPPLLVAYAGQGARVALEHIQSSRPKIGGLVLVMPAGTKDEVSTETVNKLDKNRLRILVLSDKEDEQALRSTERWMDQEGLSN